MLTSLVFAPVRTSGEGEEELLKHIFYLAKRSVSVDCGVSVAALKFITYIYEVCLGLETFIPTSWDVKMMLKLDKKILCQYSKIIVL